jgi:hypothetical protein
VISYGSVDGIDLSMSGSSSPLTRTDPGRRCCLRLPPPRLLSYTEFCKRLHNTEDMMRSEERWIAEQCYCGGRIVGETNRIESHEKRVWWLRTLLPGLPRESVVASYRLPGPSGRRTQ